MLRRQVPAASATAIVVAFAVIVSCSDSVGPGSDTPFEDPDGSINLLAGGGWNPAVKAAGAKAGKINICHSGSGKNFTSINVSVNATRAHLGDELTGIGGHEADYRISELTPCPPPAEPQRLQVCKVAGNGIAAGASYTFNVSANDEETSITIPAGSCMDAGSFRVGTDVSVQEVAQPNVNLTELTVTPPGAQLGVSDLANRRARAVVGLGVTTLTFTNTSTTHGSVVVCKVAGSGVTEGTSFSFTVAGANVNVPAGAGPTGTCSAPVVAPAGNVTATEAAVTGVVLSAVTAMSGGNNVLVSSDLPNRTATATLGAGQLTTMTFTNGAAGGTLVICKIGGTGVAAGTNFTFTVAGQTVTVAAGAPPSGTCSAPLSLAAGAHTVTETAVAGTSVSTIGGTPPPTNINLPGRSATTQITTGQQSVVTFTNVSP